MFTGALLLTHVYRIQVSHATDADPWALLIRENSFHRPVLLLQVLVHLLHSNHVRSLSRVAHSVRYSAFSGYSGTTYFNTFSLTFYNILFTGACCLPL